MESSVPPRLVMGLYSSSGIAEDAVHRLITEGGWKSTSLNELLNTLLAPFLDRISFNGPNVFLEPDPTFGLSMAVHELVTNAAKYGALSTEKGRVAIRWDRRLNGHPPRLVLEWQEIDGPPVTAPGNPSYGTSTIRDLIPY